MSVYVIAQLEVFDPEEYAKYLAGFLPVLKRHGGCVVGRSPEAKLIEGEGALLRTAIMRFPTPDDVRRWHEDRDYVALAEHRHRSAKCNIVMIDGVGG